jgi:hypothetical protein
VPFFLILEVKKKGSKGSALYWVTFSLERKTNEKVQEVYKLS